MLELIIITIIGMITLAFLIRHFIKSLRNRKVPVCNCANCNHGCPSIQYRTLVTDGKKYESMSWGNSRLHCSPESIENKN